MKSVYQIAEEAITLNNLLEESGGELTPEIEAWWDANREEAARKVDRISAVYRSLGGDIAAIDAEIDRLRGLKAHRAKAQESVTRLVETLLLAQGVDSIAGPTGGVWKRQRSGGTGKLEWFDEFPLDLLVEAGCEDLTVLPPPKPMPRALDREKIKAAMDEAVAKLPEGKAPETGYVMFTLQPIPQELSEVITERVKPHRAFEPVVRIGEAGVVPPGAVMLARLHPRAYTTKLKSPKAKVAGGAE